MPAERMGEVSRRLRMAFAVASVLFLIALAISPVKDSAARMEALQARLCALRADASRHQAPARRLSIPKSIRSGFRR